ncbi:hypothetical protein [Deinococcus roseus]|uniref:ABC transporter permease n=1 Tax=Deinococcus roseus TaxID=392414 RepID=A0ABQ2D2B7_9DEIO|nr:hypothetical protein [Deinococcus roseus]GGJ39899.1 hypothetical protein GCM10008938_27410 [Deinococcus roseus]
MKPGSLPWLLRFELLLYWRSLWSSSQKWAVVLLGGVVLGATVGLWFLLREQRGLLVGSPAELPQPLLLPFTLLGLMATLLMVTTAIQNSLQMMFERKDLDLLISSPVGTRGIFTVRVLGVVMTVSIWWVLFGLVMGLLGLLLGTWRFLGVPLAFLTLGSLISTMGVGLTFLLVRNLGLQRTRTLVQTLTVLLGALIFVATQLPNLLGSTGTGGNLLGSWMLRVQTLPASSPIWYWSRSLWLEPLPTLFMLVISVALLVGVVLSSHRAYLKGASEASGFSRPRTTSLKASPFRSGVFGLLWFKEWKLILRDPALFSQLIMQVIYLLPLFFMLFGVGRGNRMTSMMTPAFWVAATVMVSSSLTVWLGRIFIAAEDLPDLLAMAPHPRGSLRKQKMWVTLLPVFLLFIPLALVLGRSDPSLMLLGAAVLPASCLTLTYMQTQWAQPIKRADLMQKNGKAQGGVLQGFVELFTFVGWAGLVAAYGQHNTTWMLIALAVGIFFPVFFALLNHRKQSALGY